MQCTSPAWCTGNCCVLEAVGTDLCTFCSLGRKTHSCHNVPPSAKTQGDGATSCGFEPPNKLLFISSPCQGFLTVTQSTTQASCGYYLPLNVKTMSLLRVCPSKRKTKPPPPRSSSGLGAPSTCFPWTELWPGPFLLQK